MEKCIFTLSGHFLEHGEQHSPSAPRQRGQSVIQQLLQYLADVMETSGVVDGAHKIETLNRVGQPVEASNLMKVTPPLQNVALKQKL